MFLFFHVNVRSVIKLVCSKMQFYPISLNVTQRSFLLSFCQVNIQPSEWHRSLLLPQAWRGFMSRAYHAVLQVCVCVYDDTFVLWRLNTPSIRFLSTLIEPCQLQHQRNKHSWKLSVRPIAVNYRSVSSRRRKRSVHQCKHERVFG